MKFTFAKGVHPIGHKDLAMCAAIEEMPVGARVYIGVAQHIGAPATPVAKRGDTVKVGTLIAQESGVMSSNIYSSVSGTVVGIVERVTVDGTSKPHIAIDNDGKDTAETFSLLKNPTAEEIIARIRLAGIVGMGGAGFPTAVKLTPRTPVDTLIINAVECEPYITCDYRIMLEYTERVIEGIQLLQHALGDVRCIIGIECNKPDCIERMERFLKLKNTTNITVASCKTKYPQGAEKQLIYALTRRKVPTHGGLPADVGCIVHNVHTALSTYYAVTEGQPLFRRVMTVTGNGCKAPKNMWVRIGMPVSEIIEYCGLSVTSEQLNARRETYTESVAQLNASPKDKTMKQAVKVAKRDLQDAENATVAKLIGGGPMMGIAMYSDLVVSTKTMSCILMLTHDDVRAPETSPCINCGKCVRVCPMVLQPNMIEAFARLNDWEGARKYGATECIACGSCAYICPAKRPLLQRIAFAKVTILNADKALAKKKAEELVSKKKAMEAESRIQTPEEIK